MFEQEMKLGSNLANHIPDYILEGLNKLRSIKNLTQPEEKKQEEAPTEESKTVPHNDGKRQPQKDDGRINDPS